MSNPEITPKGPSPVEYLRSKGIRVTPADIPGLWWVEGYPELTTAQLVQIAREHGYPH